MDHFRALFVAGEHCDKDTLLWSRQVFSNKPVIDHYWQTETGAPVTAVCLGLDKNPVRKIKDLFFRKIFSVFLLF